MPDPSTGSGSPSTGSGSADWKPALAARLSSLRLAPAREAEIVEELSQHLDDVYRERILDGASPEDAFRLTLDELDQRDLLAREIQRLRQATALPPVPPGLPWHAWLPDLLHDLRYAVRMLRAAPGWTVVVLLLLALGIGANAAMFSATDALLLSPLHVQTPDGLVRFRWTGRNDAATDIDQYGFSGPGPGGVDTNSSFSYAVFRELANDAGGTAELFACAPYGQIDLVIDGRAELAGGFAATGNYFTVLGIKPRAGRLFVAGDDRPDAHAVAVISSRYWQARFGSDPAVIGKTIRASNVPVTIIGVTPPDFTGVQQTVGDSPDISFPLGLDRRLHASTGNAGDSALDKPTWWWLEVMGRVSSGATPARLQSMLAGPFQQSTHAAYADYMKSLTAEQRATSRRRGDVPSLVVQPGSRGAFDTDERVITSAAVLTAVVAIVLLIICANVANLLLARAVARQQEMSVRLSLGATRARLIRQVLTEGILLAFAGGALGLLVAWWGITLLPEQVSHVGVFHWHTVGFTILAALITSLLFGTAPALRGTRAKLGSLNGLSRRIVGRTSIVARTLLVVQVTLSLVLLVGAGLFLRTVVNLSRADVGFNPRNLLLVQITPFVAGYYPARTTALYRELLDRLAAAPGVRGVTLANKALLAGGVNSTDIYVEGRSYPPNQRRSPETEINRLVVAPNFFDVIGIHLALGRTLAPTDDKNGPRVAVINEAAARKFFPGVNPVGRRFGGSPTKTSQIEVVGVVADTKYSSLRESAPPTLYLTYMQQPTAQAWLELRTAGPPATVTSAVRAAVREVAPTLPLARVSTQLDEIQGRMLQEKLFSQAYAIFGGIALLLASIGLFGLMSYTVGRRTGEMGVRIALGAQRGDVLRLVMRESLVLVAIGLAAGLAIALATGRLVATLLFEVPPRDPMTMAVAAGVMVAVCGAAAYLPARRASRVDPVTALRSE